MTQFSHANGHGKACIATVGLFYLNTQSLKISDDNQLMCTLQQIKQRMIKAINFHTFIKSFILKQKHAYGMYIEPRTWFGETQT